MGDGASLELTANIVLGAAIVIFALLGLCASVAWAWTTLIRFIKYRRIMADINKYMPDTMFVAQRPKRIHRASPRAGLPKER